MMIMNDREDDDHDGDEKHKKNRALKREKGPMTASR